MIANIQNAETVTREPEYSSRAANHTAMDMGNTYAEVDLTTQHMWFIKDGQIALETDIVTGNPNKGNATPQGTYSLAYKSKNKTLRGRNQMELTSTRHRLLTGCHLMEVSDSTMQHGSLHLEATDI